MACSVDHKKNRVWIASQMRRIQDQRQFSPQINPRWCRQQSCTGLFVSRPSGLGTDRSRYGSSLNASLHFSTPKRGILDQPIFSF